MNGSLGKRYYFIGDRVFLASQEIKEIKIILLVIIHGEKFYNTSLKWREKETRNMIELAHGQTKKIDFLGCSRCQERQQLSEMMIKEKNLKSREAWKKVKKDSPQ